MGSKRRELLPTGRPAAAVVAALLLGVALALAMEWAGQQQHPANIQLFQLAGLRYGRHSRVFEGTAAKVGGLQGAAAQGRHANLQAQRGMRRVMSMVQTAAEGCALPAGKTAPHTHLCSCTQVDAVGTRSLVFDSAWGRAALKALQAWRSSLFLRMVDIYSYQEYNQTRYGIKFFPHR